MLQQVELTTPDQLHRLKKLKAAFIERPQIASAVNTIVNYFHLNRDGMDHGFLYLVGEPGAGKTTVIKRAMAIIAEQCAEESAWPVAYFLLPENCSRKDFMSKCLESIGDPTASLGTRVSMEQRYHKAARKKNVLMTFVDEFGHIVSSEDDEVNKIVGDLIKLFCEAWRRPVVFAGLPRAVRVLQSNDQLLGRRDERIELQLLSLENDSAVIECQTALRDYDDQLPFPDFCMLAEPAAMVAHVKASDGCPRIITKLTRLAGSFAIRAEKRRIEIEHWQMAWNNLLGDAQSGRPNPYAGLALPRSITKPFRKG